MHLFVFTIFFSESAHIALLVQNIFLIGGLTLLLAAESWHWIKCSRTSRLFVKNVLLHKKNQLQ
jgi:hypothetical protein